MTRHAAGADLEEIEAVYKRDLAKLQRVATAITGSHEAGYDAVQDAFAQAVYRRADFRREGTLEGWLWRIVLSRARDAAARLEPVAPADADDRSASATTTDEAEHAALRDAVSRLPERQRFALFLRYYADLDYRAIADALEIAAGTVGATLNHARENLRRLLMEVPK